MSRKANKPIVLPAGVTATVTGQMITVQGPKGELQLNVHPLVNVVMTDAGVVLTVRQPDDTTERSLWGTMGALVRNMLIGVSVGYTVQLEINGVGYGFEVSGKKLTIRAGFSHPVIMTLPEGVTVKQEKNVLTLSSHDKQLVGQLAAEIRKVRKPEPYKGKGIKYIDEVIIRKQGKQAAGATS
ncbi:MAG: 50S ribosomal protein L6 [Candidatus Kerfeldbacteria bacterium]|nr:50S ribosomal protein L6 [Candidatus Kerfeldbacteria bacterium]